MSLSLCILVRIQAPEVKFCKYLKKKEERDQLWWVFPSRLRSVVLHPLVARLQIARAESLSQHKMVTNLFNH